MVSILGPSGSGKSTLLQIMGLLMKADAGQIYLDGIDYAALSEKDQATFRNKKLGFVFQFHHLLGEFTCEENIKFPLFIKGSKLDEADLELFDKIVQTLGIQPILHKLPSQISGGEQQRVAVARALINRPTLLLADEPTGNLDNKNAETLYALFVELKAVWQQRIIMVTHNEKLTSHSDQVIYLNSGRIE
jgi:lipoprotein-releasing system ATP-binding protein